MESLHADTCVLPCFTFLFPLSSFHSILATLSIMQSAFRIWAVLVIVILLLAGADYWFKELPHRRVIDQQHAKAVVPERAEEPVTPPTTQNSGTSSSRSTGSRIVKKGTSIRKNSGVDVQALLVSLQLVAEPTNETSLLTLITRNTQVQTVVLLQNNDRAALLSWTLSDDVKTMFSSLKTALQERFSPKLTHLIDETRTPPDGPPVDVLSFNDPAISPEKVLFLRVRNRLYELHIAEKAKDSIHLLVAALSK